MDCTFNQLRRRLLYLFVLLIGANIFQPAPASSVRTVGLEEMVAASELIFEGQAVRAESHWNSTGTEIRTVVTFEVADVIKGRAQTRIQLSFAGGTIGALTLSISDSQIPLPGEKGIYFIEDTETALVNPLYGWHQGRFLLVSNPKSHGELVLTAAARPVIALEIQSAERFTKHNLISRGAARGVIAGSRAQWQAALPKHQFKQRLEHMVSALLAR